MADTLPPIHTIEITELADKLGRDKFRLVMALNEWAFKAKHIPGSEHFNTEAELLSAIDPDEEVVVYCTNEACHASVALYYALLEHGFKDVRRYSGGMQEWEEKGMPIEGDWAD